MANHVYNYIEVSGTDEVLNKFQEMGKGLITERETTDWEGKPMSIKEYNGIEELDFMPEYEEERPEFDHDIDEWTDEMYEAYDDLVYNWLQDQTV